MHELFEHSPAQVNAFLSSEERLVCNICRCIDSGRGVLHTKFPQGKEYFRWYPICGISRAPWADTLAYVTSEVLSYDVRDRVAWIRWDDGRANTFTNAVFERFLELLDRAAEDDDVGAVVLAGREGFFSAGIDLKWLQQCSHEDRGEIGPNLARLAHRVFIFPRPVIAAIEGHCIAGGAILSLACDRTVGVEGDYKVGVNEVALGIPFGGFALELARAHLTPSGMNQGPLYGETFSPARAAEVGYLDELVPAGQLEERVMEIAGKAAEFSDFAYFTTKQIMRGELAERIKAQAESGELVPLFQALADMQKQAGATA